MAISFINECISRTEYDFHIFLSESVLKQFRMEDLPEHFTLYHIPNYPSSLRNRLKTVRQLNRLEKSINPDCVFSVFGPSYWRPVSPHIIGFALGWTINPDSIAYRLLSVKQRIKRKLKNALLLRQIRSDADVFVVETEEVKRRLNLYGGVAIENIRVVSNTASHYFFEKSFEEMDLPGKSGFSFCLVTISANYPHKNLAVIKEVLPHLKELDPQNEYGFYVTIPQDEFEVLFGEEVLNIINLGPVDVKYCPGVYSQCDAVFLPTLLESFSASYPEAMAMGRPIITTDLDFARTLCGKAAEFFSPLDSRDMAEKIIALAGNPDRRKMLVEEGAVQLKQFYSPAQRATEYLNICNEIVN